MLLSILISATIAMFGLLFIRLSVSCVDNIPWSVLLTFLAIFSLMSIILHSFQMKCWRFLTWGPQRLRSVTDEESNVKRYDFIPQVVLYIWVFCFGAISIFNQRCGIPLFWPILSLGILIIYTASTFSGLSLYCSCGSSEKPKSTLSSEPDSEPSSVKTSREDLDSHSSSS